MRSQDKQKLKCVDDVFIYNVQGIKDKPEDPFDYEYRYSEIYASSGEAQIKLGTYSSEERALQVLDEIQKGICYTKRTELFANVLEGMSDTDMMQFVFQMPEE